jgi:hypothetical protein
VNATSHGLDFADIFRRLRMSGGVLTTGPEGSYLTPDIHPHTQVLLGCAMRPVAHLHLLQLILRGEIADPDGSLNEALDGRLDVLENPGVGSSAELKLMASPLEGIGYAQRARSRVPRSSSLLASVLVVRGLQSAAGRPLVDLLGSVPGTLFRNGTNFNAIGAAPLIADSLVGVGTTPHRIAEWLQELSGGAFELAEDPRRGSSPIISGYFSGFNSDCMWKSSDTNTRLHAAGRYGDTAGVFLWDRSQGWAACLFSDRPPAMRLLCRLLARESPNFQINYPAASTWRGALRDLPVEDPPEYFCLTRDMRPYKAWMANRRIVVGDEQGLVFNRLAPGIFLRDAGFGPEGLVFEKTETGLVAHFDGAMTSAEVPR